MKKPLQEKKWIVFFTTYPPLECGIATFIADLIRYFDEIFSPKKETKVVAMDSSFYSYTYPSKGILEISENNEDDYKKAAEALNGMEEVKIISIQHEFGIFGDEYGKNLIAFLDHIRKPVIVTLHT